MGRCRGLQGTANAAYTKGFLFSGLQRVGLYCVPGGIRVVPSLALLEAFEFGSHTGVLSASYDSALPPVGLYCARGGVRVVSKVLGFHIVGCLSGES